MVATITSSSYAWHEQAILRDDPGDHLWQEELPMAAMLGLGGQSMADILGPGGPILRDHQWHDSHCR